ncbi:uncharacterized protein LAESUDRAFT_723460 [Laetiporus sulphureus 93-53]|uniref:Ser-Thr-rich glycosyl-phosphatidyl-inositol-anchored membrane family-domain-containing protein n=1 Tax=Laetiporus sulphureus 93-53 TaxID=1314785 RepID=A0A165F8G1_9APHY|nr:uncharacterized protein LAESUDRAFT_723460 [Laetiporus sulphureus 93-53]KZT08587.1 hypothetical protein LAESUDRAFT_723460 [Laetiporus sulphureus 93-53]
MLFKLSALIALVPLASALVLETPNGWQSNGVVNISWVTASGDPSSVSFELTNPDIFHNSYAIATNIQSSLGFLSLTLPTVDVGSGYYLEAVNVSNINDVFAETGEFSVAAPPSTTASSSTSAASSSGASSASLTSSGSAASTASGASSSGASGASSTAANAASSGASSGTSSAPSSTVSTFNGAGHLEFSYGSMAVMAIGAVAGAVAAL